MRHRTTTELLALPTLRQGQADDLKIDTGKMRVWLSRCGKADGEPFEPGVGRWETTERYDGGEPDVQP